LGLQLVGEIIYIFARGYPGFVLSAVVGGVGFAFGSGCVEGLIYDALKATEADHKMSKAIGHVEAAQRLANLIAFSIGGALVRNLTQQTFVVAIVATASMVGIGFLISFTLQNPSTQAHHSRQDSPLQLLKEGLELLRSNKLFRRLALLSLATIPFRDYLGSLYQPHFVEARVRPLWFGLALSLASGLSILGARYAYWLERKLGSRHSIPLVTALPGLLYLLMAAISHPSFSVLVFCALYGSISLRNPILSAQLNAHIKSQNRATVLSVISMISGIYVSLIGLAIGRVADVSVPYAFLAMGILVLTGTLLFRKRNQEKDLAII
jgi:hypothetical protein